MYATLGIEQDDSSDDDFVPDDADEAGDGDQVSDDFSDDSEELGRQGKMQATKGGKSSGNLSAAKGANRQQASLKRRGSDSASGDTDRGPTASTRPEYTPRKRASKHLKEMEAMRAHGDEIVNVVPPFPSGLIANWKEFATLFKTYTEQNNIKFRVRSSEATERHNSTHDDPIPTDFL
ncbi:hypothetical protein PF002_g11512 [Phytophthora fragariae]|uniref:Uncharacterized protein n=1 Tax=Phytophthora fragariae TaxID=53985 RepID=A0A6A3ZHZ6_9STRA|nr:hypothetical protein PF011_g12754 [Phytophthora fragariae]KAE9235520.1 hypothetical protein PF002_g11512 [Phytophthora fragariae]